MPSIDLGGQVFVIFGFWLKNQPFLQKKAEFPKMWLNNDLKTVPTDLESQYMTFIEKTSLKWKNIFFGYFWLIFGCDFVILWFLGYPYKVLMKHFHGWYWYQSIQYAQARLSKVFLTSKIADNGCFRIFFLQKWLNFLKSD